MIGFLRLWESVSAALGDSKLKFIAVGVILVIIATNAITAIIANILTTAIIVISPP